MKKNIFKLLILYFLMLTQCNNFPTSFEQIGHNKIRVLDFKYQNKKDTSLVEAAPGDSMRLTAFISGTQIKDIRWEISYTVKSTKAKWIPSVSNDKIFSDIHPLHYRQVNNNYPAFSNATQIVCLDLKIPDSILYYNSTISDTIFSSLGITKTQGLTIIDSLIDKPWKKWLSIFFKDSSNQDKNKQLVAIIQSLTVDVGIRAVINNIYIVESSTTVRYNRYFKDSGPKIFSNQNPEIRWAGIIKSAGKHKNALNLHAISTNDTLYLLYKKEDFNFPGIIKKSDTIFIEDDFSYFAIVDSGFCNSNDLRDSATAINSAGTFFTGQETWYPQWFCQHDSAEISGVNPENYAKIKGERLMDYALGKPLELFIPPADRRITSATLWVVVFDNFIGERLRPQGSNLIEMKAFFKY